MWVAIATPDWDHHGQEETKEIKRKDNHQRYGNEGNALPGSKVVILSLYFFGLLLSMVQHADTKPSRMASTPITS